MKTARSLVALLAVTAVLALGAVVALGAPHSVTGAASFAGASRAGYCPDKQRRLDALARFDEQAPARRAAFFKKNKSPKARAAFVKQQQARRAKLVSALANCN